MTTFRTPNTDYETRRQQWQESIAATRAPRADNSSLYKRVLWQLLANDIPPGATVLHVGCGTGDVLAMLKPRNGVGVEPSTELAAEARRRHPEMEVIESPLDAFETNTNFEYIIVADVLIDCFDVDDLLECVRRSADASTRIVITNYSQLWRPILKLARALGLARPRFGDTWFSPADLQAALKRRGFDVITSTPAVLVPLRIPLVAPLANRILARLPLFRALCLHHTCVARRASTLAEVPQSVSVIVPARNEAGNVERLMSEIPVMGTWTEVIFVEGNSTDDTWAVLEVAVRQRNDPRVRLIKQPGKGKGDAVRAGFSEAKGDILMILDADLTVPAEMLPRFYEVVSTGHADFANGTRLVYRMDGRAMQFLNLLANHFFAAAFSFVLGQSVRDTLCGTKVVHRTLYERIAANRAYFGDFDPFGDFDLLFGAARLHAKIVDVPIRYRERVYGETNISRFRHGLLLFKMLGIAAVKLKFR